MRYFLVLSYHGKRYHGWQVQPNALTVQETLEDALSVLLKQKTTIVGAGRTDSGVHASYMVAHFEVNAKLNTTILVYKLNALLPYDIAVHNIRPVSLQAHARFDAIEREYVYKITVKKNVFTTDFAYFFKPKLDVELMNEAARVLFQYDDFECFSKTHTDVKTFICKIKTAQWEVFENELHFTISADRFLRNMVRAIVGTLINIGIGKLTIEDLHTIIKSKNRSRAGYSVPAHGLYLQAITYPSDIFLK